MELIGITGLRGSGKSTLARHLCMAYNFDEVSFADPLKHGIKEMFLLSGAELGLFVTSSDQHHKKEEVDPFWGVTPRELMQVIGTDLMREELPKRLPQLRNVWIRSCERRLGFLKHSGSRRVVISDVRFPDEVAFIRSQGGRIWHVRRPGQESSGFTQHSSEGMAQQPDSFQPDVIFDNTGTVEDLLGQVDAQNHLSI
jgi:energy-coupling factor transporter ATP-binding protein EcfA2